MAEHFMTVKVPVTHCVDCGREFDVQIAYGSGGMCWACARRRRVPTTRSYAPLETVLDEYRFLRDAGVDVRDMPGRLGMTRDAFERALYRGRKAGDPRVADFRGMGAAA